MTLIACERILLSFFSNGVGLWCSRKKYQASRFLTSAFLPHKQLPRLPTLSPMSAVKSSSATAAEST